MSPYQILALSGDPIDIYTNIIGWALVLPLGTVTLIGIFSCLRRRRWRLVLLYSLLTPIALLAVALSELPKLLGLIYLAVMALILIIRGKATRIRYPFED